MSGQKCRLCGKPVDDAHRPFCSRRCADVDLHRWLGGAYRIETDETPEPGEPAFFDPEDNRTG